MFVKKVIQFGSMEYLLKIQSDKHREMLKDLWHIKLHKLQAVDMQTLYFYQDAEAVLRQQIAESNQFLLPDGINHSSTIKVVDKAALIKDSRFFHETKHIVLLDDTANELLEFDCYNDWVVRSNSVLLHSKSHLDFLSLINEGCEIVEFCSFCQNTLGEPAQEVSHYSSAGGKMPIDPVTMTLFWSLVERERELRLMISEIDLSHI